MRPTTMTLSCLAVAVVTLASREAVSPGTLSESPARMSQSGDFVYLSGIVGNRPGSGEIPRDIESQVRQVMDNVGAALREHGLGFADVARANVFLADTRHFAAMNSIYRTYFPDDPPTRATVQAAIPVPGALLQVDMVAVRPGVGRRVVVPEGMVTPELPYSWGVMAGNTLFIAGTTARDPRTYQPVGGDAGAQTRQVLENIGRVLRGAGMDYGDVATCSVFLDDARNFQAMNEVYRSFFPADPPARATVQARLMNPAFLVEIQCVASAAAGRRVVIAEGAEPPASPYSPAVAVGDRLYLAGMVGRGAQGFAVGNPAEQTRQAMRNLRATLRAAGMDFDDVEHALVFISDIRYDRPVREAYLELLPYPVAPTTVVGSTLMSADALVEIMMTARR